jgi:hypothetical protein
VSFDCNYRSLLWEDRDTNPKAALAEGSDCEAMARAD